MAACEVRAVLQLSDSTTPGRITNLLESTRICESGLRPQPNSNEKTFVMPRYSEASSRLGEDARCFGVPQHDAQNSCYENKKLQDSNTNPSKSFHGLSGFPIMVLFVQIRVDSWFFPEAARGHSFARKSAHQRKYSSKPGQAVAPARMIPESRDAPRSF
jgi:hypothetical protein